MPFLTELIQAYGGQTEAERKGDRWQITAITADSRLAVPGSLFIAIAGAKADGTDYIEDAVARGAVAVVSEQVRHIKAESVCWVKVENARLALARMAAAFHAPQPEWVAAVTGTDGKTSTVEFFRQLWELQGIRAASIGTLGIIGIQNSEFRIQNPGASQTTPDPVVLHQTLMELNQRGIAHVGMEASSHGLAQYRLHGVRVEAAAFTNLTRDHLDYHGTPEAYAAAKSKLFSEIVMTGGTAVLNADDAYSEVLREMCAQRDIRVLSYGKAGADLRLLSQKPTAQGQDIVIEVVGRQVAMSLGLVGNFQAMNILAALGLVIGCGGGVEGTLTQITKLKGVSGRLEKVAAYENGAAIYIDYAHTPAALQNLLVSLRPHVTNHLWVVFGCGGDRDKGKRLEMGKAACAFADHAIITDDNPRSEDPARIRREVITGCPDATEIPDRREAIHFAAQRLKPGDVLVIAGKGHEKTQTIGADVLPFDDAQVAREAMRIASHA